MKSSGCEAVFSARILAIVEPLFLVVSIGCYGYI